MENRLVLRFTTAEEGKYFTITLNNIKTDGATGASLVTEAQANTLMDLIVQKGIFYCTYGALTGKKDAKVISTLEQDFNIV
ncbi:MAG: DUF2922 domain-containing protein [Solirubrobacterales bacterium]